MPVKRKMVYAHEARDLFQVVNGEYHRVYPQAGRVTNSVLFAYAWSELQKLPDYSAIRWPEVARVNVLGPTNAANVRYGSSLTLPASLYPSIDFRALELFRVARKADCIGIRRNCYLPFCVRLILRAFFLYVVQGNAIA